MLSDDQDPGEQTIAVQRCLGLLREGKDEARGELLEMTQDRLLRLTAKMKQSFRGVARWEQTEDVFQNASIRLYQSMADTEINDVRHFFRLAALQIRRELLDMCRHHRGPQGHGANHATQMPGSASINVAPIAAHADANETDLQAWSDFHQCVDELPDREKEIFELLWYHEMKQEEVAELLGVSVRSVKRLWRSARLLLQDRLSDQVNQSIAY